VGNGGIWTGSGGSGTRRIELGASLIEKAGDLRLQRRKGRCTGFGSHEDENVPFGKVLIQVLERCSGSALLTVPRWLRSDGLRGRESDQTTAVRDDQATVNSLKASAFLENLIKTRFVRSNYRFASLCRPFSRRRFKVFWPSVVLIRTRNPWVVCQWRLFGW